MDLGIKGKVAIVAASSKGLGKAVAMGLAEEGVKVTICARGEETLKEAAREIESRTGAEILAICADVTQLKDIKNLVSETVKKHGNVDILVNNAGGPPLGIFPNFSEEDWKKAVELNLMSTINLTREAIPYMQRQKWGRIINITSVAVKQPIEGLILSNTVRAGVVGLAKTLSNELAADNITVNNICPGRILTDRIRSLAQGRAKQQGKSPEEIMISWENDIPMRRLGKPEELANLVVFLASERAAYITGTTVQVDGGVVKSLL